MKIHLIGVGGAAMGNLAAMLKKTGHRVTGSDHALYPPMSERLKEWEIEADAFDPDRITGRGSPRADLFIVGNAISRGNPEIEAVLDEGLPLMSMPQALHEFFLSGKRVQVVAGTHGKTTTTFLLHHILDRAGLKPGLFAGGIRGDGHPGFALPDGNLFVIEGDEYDTAFFDKGPKFLHYRPRDLILTHVEYDHADIYENFEHYKRSFKLLLRWIPSSGNVAAFAGSAGVREVIQSLPAGNLTWYGNEGDENFSDTFGNGAGPTIPSIATGRRIGRRIALEGIGEIEVPFIGRHNTANALAAGLIAQRLGVSARDILSALSSFAGVLRRQQIRTTVARGSNQLVLMEDFAHHPTAVTATVEAVREAYPGFRIVGLFEPRSATSHRNTFQQEYGQAFSLLDELWITDVFNPKKVAAEDRLDVPALVEGLHRADRPAHFASDPAGLADRLMAAPPPEHPTVFLAMSNGGFGGIYDRIEKWIESASDRKTPGGTDD